MTKKMTVSQAIRSIKTSWYENVQASTISKCFASCGFPIVGDVPNNETIISEEDWTMLTETLAIEDPTYDEGDIEVFHTLGDEWEDEILHPVMEEIKSDEQEESESSDDEAIPAWKEMYENWNKFYIMYQFYSENEVDQQLHDANKFFIKKSIERLKATRITDFVSATKEVEK